MGGKLEEAVVRDGVLTPIQLAAAAEDMRRTRKSLAESIIDLGFVDERLFAEWVSNASGTSLLDPLPEQEVARLIRRLPPSTARECQVIAVGEDAGRLLVALVDPLDEATVQIVRSTSGAEVVSVTGIRSSIERLVNQFYPEQFDADFTLLPAPLGEPPDPPVTKEAPPAEEEPFVFGNETLIASRRSLLAFDEPAPQGDDGEFGTMMVRPHATPKSEPPAPAESPAKEPAAAGQTTPADPLTAIERRLDQLVLAIDKVQKRLDAMDATLAKVFGAKADDRA